MSVLRITKHGEAVLKRKSKPIIFDEIKPELPKLLEDMWETMYAANGVGLAAPQIGINIRLAVIDVKPDGKSQRLVLINPELVRREGEVVEEEGCLSVPGLYAKTKRAARVKVRALNAYGIPVELTGEGLLARAFQHEIDHLNGTLFIDTLPLVRRLKVQALIRRIKKNWN